MLVIKCPFCYKDFEVNISKAVDEDGEVYMCPSCGNLFRYTEK